jgi:hypothetical protein
VVGDGFAKRRLGGVDKAIGQELIVNSLPVTVVGVAGAAFVGAWTMPARTCGCPSPSSTTLDTERT